MNTDTNLTTEGCGNCSGGSCGAGGCTGDAATCTKDDCCKKSDSSEKKTCDTCGTELKSGMKYTDICTTCEPIYLKRCSDKGCGRILWDCMCIKPHTWE